MTVILSYMFDIVIFVLEISYCMKILFAICLMSTVLCSEFSTILDCYGSELSHIESNCEGETEKETKEHAEDFSKVKIRQRFNFEDSFAYMNDKDLISKWTISTPYLEINSPPPEVI